ncbi:MAG TPA: hypothetical protein VHX38_40440 [Pseudonocardiaceae bacterium]|nr:hypothetical protein [Pseudonocardiaceae bacterium]
MRYQTVWRTGVLALPLLVAGLLVGCGGGSTNTSTNSIAHPKKVTSATKCESLVSAGAVATVTGLTATRQTDSASAADCGFDLAGKAGADAGQVTIGLGPNHAGSNGVATAAQAGGNPAQQQKLSGLGPGQYGCALFVTLNDNASLNTLTVTVLTFQPTPDACTSAKAVATNAFDQLPAA